jgi:hypothetical protein
MQVVSGQVIAAEAQHHADYVTPFNIVLPATKSAFSRHH